MILNRYFKTTAGVPFELALGKTLPTYADFNAQMADLTQFTLGAYAINPSLKVAAGLPPNTPIKGTSYDTSGIFFGFSQEVDPINGNQNVWHTTSLLFPTIKAEYIPYAAPVKESVTMAQTAGTISYQQVLNVKVVETTPMNQPLPVWNYTEFMWNGLQAALTTIVNRINALREEEFFTASSTANSITIVSKIAARHFRVMVNVTPTAQDRNEYGVIFTPTINAKAFAGSGTLEQMIELEREANVRRGIGHYYTDKVTTGTTGSEFGLPVSVVKESGVTQWDLISLSGIKMEESPTPVDFHKRNHFIFIAVPAGQGSQIANLFSNPVTITEE